MPPDSASPSAVPPVRRSLTLAALLDQIAKLGTVECTCGGPKCPGTLARAAQPSVDVQQRERIANLEKRVEFQRELARLINRLGHKRTFGNRTDFDLARLAWEFLEVKPLPTPTTDVAAESPKPEAPKAPAELPPLDVTPQFTAMVDDLLALLQNEERATGRKEGMANTLRRIIEERDEGQRRLREIATFAREGRAREPTPRVSFISPSPRAG